MGTAALAASPRRPNAACDCTSSATSVKRRISRLLEHRLTPTWTVTSAPSAKKPRFFTFTSSEISKRSPGAATTASLMVVASEPEPSPERCCLCLRLDQAAHFRKWNIDRHRRYRACPHSPAVRCRAGPGRGPRLVSFGTMRVSACTPTSSVIALASIWAAPRSPASGGSQARDPARPPAAASEMARQSSTQSARAAFSMNGIVAHAALQRAGCWRPCVEHRPPPRWRPKARHRRSARHVDHVDLAVRSGASRRSRRWSGATRR